MRGGNFTLELPATNKFFNNELPKMLQDPVSQIWSVSTSFAMYSPEFGRPLPVDKASILCAPAGGQVNLNNFFTVNATMPNSTENHVLAY